MAAKAFNPESTDKTGFYREVKATVIMAGKIQEKLHNLAVAASIQWLKHQNTDWAVYLIEQLNPVSGTVRSQALAYWFTNAVGLYVEIDKNGIVKAKKNTKFDWSRETDDILGFGRSNPYYNLAPQEKPLSAPKLPIDSFAVVAARALLTGEVTEEDLQKEIGRLMDEIQKRTKDKKVTDWVEKYQAQIAETAE